MVFIKIIVSLAVIALASAQQGHHATSYSSVNSYNTHVAHEYKPHAAPIHHHQAAPAAPTHQYHHAPAPAPSVHHAAPISVQAAPAPHKQSHHEEHYHHHPKYQFKYGVEDKKTHDIKSQEESRDGDVVKGYYTLLQPDGRTRTVHYTADKHNGFQAHVEYSGHAAHPEVQHKAQPTHHH